MTRMTALLCTLALGLTACDEKTEGTPTNEAAQKVTQATPDGEKKKAPETNSGWKIAPTGDSSLFQPIEGRSVNARPGSGDAPAMMVLSNTSPFHTIALTIPVEGSKELTKGEHAVLDINLDAADFNCGTDKEGEGLTVTVEQEEPLAGTLTGTVRCGEEVVAVTGSFEDR